MNYSPTVATLEVVTLNSSAFTRLVWEGLTSTSGDLTVTYKSGGTYRFAGVYVTDMLDILHAADEHRSMGAALYGVVGHRKGELVTA